MRVARVVKPCRDCGLTFTVSRQEHAWFRAAGLDVPKRCPACREVQRALQDVTSQETIR